MTSTQASHPSVKPDAYAGDFTHRLAGVADAVETFLVDLLGPTLQAGEIARPPRLMEAMRHAVLGGAEDAALAAGAGVELVHCYSLVHDDLPAMDDDDLRRGKPTVHKAYDEATAILVGDALQTLAFEVTADPRWQPDPAILAELVLGLARASGLGGMVGGQLLDLSAEGRFGPADMDLDDTLRMQAMKTGAILAFSVEAGAWVGGANADERAALLRYGKALGQAFQVADDILDREASPEAMGKATGKDKDAGKATLVDRLGLDGARAECDRLVALCEEAVAPWGEQAQVLKDAARFTVARKA